MSKYTIGIDLGSRTVKGLLLNIQTGEVEESVITDTGTESKAVADNVFNELVNSAGLQRSDVGHITATGYGRYMPEFADKIATEITCHAVGVHSLHPETKTIIDIGGQDSKAIFFDENGKVRDFIMNDRCAAGTGRFLEVVAKILETDTNGLSEMAMKASQEVEISSMCVVFAESEVIGLLSRGVTRENISAGIHTAISRRIAGMAERGKCVAPIVFTGGVALNKAMVITMGNELKERLKIPVDPRFTGALGAAIISAKQIGREFEPGEVKLFFNGAEKMKNEEKKIELKTESCCGDLKPEKVSSCCEEMKSVASTCCETENSSCCGEIKKTVATCCESSDEKIAEKVSACCGESTEKSGCCDESKPEKTNCCGDEKPTSSCCESTEEQTGIHSVPALAHFDRMVSNCIETAQSMKSQGTKIVSMFCEYTPRELIMAVGAIPVCACGGSHNMAVASERDLPSNLCPLIKSSYGFAIEHANPIFEMSDLVIAETTCDGKKKMYEIMSQSKPMHILELTQKPDEESAFEHWMVEIKLLVKKLEELTGNKLTDENLLESIKLMNKERSLRLKIADFAGSVLTGREVLDSKSLISGTPCDLKAYEDIITQARDKQGKQDHKPRVLMTGVPLPHGAEKVLDIIEEAGAVVVCQENCTGVKPLIDNISEEGNLLENLARKYFKLPCSVMMPNKGRFDLLDDLIKKHKPDGVVDLIWQACHTYNIESELLKNHVRDKHDLPFLKIETDYSPSDTGQLRLRIDSFLSIIEEKKE